MKKLILLLILSLFISHTLSANMSIREFRDFLNENFGSENVDTRGHEFDKMYYDYLANNDKSQKSSSDIWLENFLKKLKSKTLKSGNYKFFKISSDFKLKKTHKLRFQAKTKFDNCNQLNISADFAKRKKHEIEPKDEKFLRWSNYSHVIYELVNLLTSRNLASCYPLKEMIGYVDISVPENIIQEIKLNIKKSDKTIIFHLPENVRVNFSPEESKPKLIKVTGLDELDENIKAELKSKKYKYIID